jgi:transposase InsO family protein
MPFTGVSAMDFKLEFVRLALAQDANRRELCRRFGISPTLGYRLLSRYAAQGDAGLVEQSRRPRASPRATPDAVEAAVMAVRAEHPAWGGRKIAAVLRRRGLAAPSPSTVTQILRRHGAALGAFGGGHEPFIRFEHAAPNDLWQMDFKGHVPFAAGPGRLHPLTVLDDHSRFCVALEACADQERASVKSHLVKAFRRYGLPRRITADNGPPWSAGMAGGGVSRPWTALGVWLLEHDVALSHSRPYHPQTQGKDERFHRTLKAEALSGRPFADLDEAARHLQSWRTIYNTQRPHEALDLKTPIERYAPSSRSYSDHVEPFAYGPDDLPRRVDDGRISFNARRIRVPKAFSGKILALRPTHIDGQYDLVFRAKTITTIDLAGPM